MTAIDGSYDTYHFDIVADPRASIEAAVAEAAYLTLRNHFPAQAASLDALHGEALALIPEDAPKTTAGRSEPPRPRRLSRFVPTMDGSHR